MSFEFSVISGRVVRDVVFGNLEQCVEVVRRAYLAHGRGETLNPNSYFLRFPSHPSRRIIALPAHIDAEFRVSGIKWIASFPENIKRGFPRASATLVLNHADTGYPIALLEASIISAARTAASAALAARALRPARSVRLGVIGTGLIARYVCEFLRGTGWVFDDVHLFDLERVESERFSQRVFADAAIRVQIAPDIQSAIRASDVVVFATTAGVPHLHDYADFAHCPLVLHLSLRDLGPEIIARSANYTDDVGHALNAATSLELAVNARGSREFINGTVADLLLGKAAVPEDRPLIFSPFGLGILDIAVGKWVYDRARQSGQAVDIPDFFFELER